MYTFKMVIISRAIILTTLILVSSCAHRDTSPKWKSSAEEWLPTSRQAAVEVTDTSQNHQELFDSSGWQQQEFNSSEYEPQSIRTKKKNNISNEKRYAFIVGNGGYKFGPLLNPANDAQDIAKSLQSLGFEVSLQLNSNHQNMENGIKKFVAKIASGGISLFYYAGHAVQFNGGNYLIPIGGSQIENQSDIKYKSVNLGQILDGMGRAKSRLNIVILDACRDNPLPRSYSRSSKRGLVRVSSPQGTLLIFSTSPGSTASDGKGKNGLFTKHFLKHMKTPNLPIEKVLKLVSRGVKKESHYQQTPWWETSFDGEFSFANQ